MNRQDQLAMINRHISMISEMISDLLPIDEKGNLGLTYAQMIINLANFKMKAEGQRTLLEELISSNNSNASVE